MPKTDFLMTEAGTFFAGSSCFTYSGTKLTTPLSNFPKSKSQICPI